MTKVRDATGARFASRPDHDLANIIDEMLRDKTADHVVEDVENDSAVTMVFALDFGDRGERIDLYAIVRDETVIAMLTAATVSRKLATRAWRPRETGRPALAVVPVPSLPPAAATAPIAAVAPVPAAPVAYMPPEQPAREELVLSDGMTIAQAALGIALVEASIAQARARKLELAAAADLERAQTAHQSRVDELLSAVHQVDLAHAAIVAAAESATSDGSATVTA